MWTRALLATLLLGCLEVPPALAPLDAGTDAPPAPHALTLERLEVEDARGRPWPTDGIPERPVLRVVLSEPAGGEAPPLYLFSGAGDDALLGDLADAPLRVATRERIVPCDVGVDGASLTLRPLERLERGASLTVAAAAWLATADGRALEAPWTEELRVGAAAGARVIGSWPPDGAATVPPSMPELAIRLDGPFEGASAGVSLRARGERVAGAARSADCRAIGWPDGSCAVFVPDRPLARGTEHRLTVEDELIDHTGAAIGPWEAVFTTAMSDDLEPPAFIETGCALDAVPIEGVGCATSDDASITLELQASEPVRVRLSAPGRELVALAPRGHAALTLDGLLPDTSLRVHVLLDDLGGLARELDVLLATTPPLATLGIVEVRANPNGREPRQELVEVLNFGAMPVPLAGLSLSDRPDAVGDVIDSGLVVAPGQRALLVANEFDPDDAQDAPVPAGALLVRIGTSIATAGLSNAGEALFLRDGELRRLSASPPVPVPEGLCLVRIDEARPRPGSAEAFAVGPCTPGRGP